MSTGITVLSAEKGVYRHAPTGFTVHEIRSVDEAIAYNGVLAIDAENGYWAWVLGEDLAIEVYGRSKVTLAALARELLEQEYQIEYERIIPGYWGEKDGVTYTGSIMVGGLVTATKTISSDLRIFGIANNAQAGRGCSAQRIATTAYIGSLEVNRHGFIIDSSLYDPYTRPDRSIAIMEHTPFDTSRVSHAFTPGAGVVGRIIIAVPAGTWAEWLAKFVENMPNHDQAEVQAKATIAVNRFNEEIRPHLYTQPAVRVPMILTSDGKMWLESNPTASVLRSHLTAPISTHGYYNPFLSPSLPDESGWWITNPVLLQPGIAHNIWGGATIGLDQGMDEVVNGIPASNSTVSFTNVCSQLTAIGGVELHKILGGVYPHTDGSAIDVPTHSVINRVFNHNHYDDEPPAIGAASPAAYDATLTTKFSSLSFQHERYNWGHWWLAGQPLLLATAMLESFIVGKSLRGDAAVRVFSGHLCSEMRVKTGGPQLNSHHIPDVSAVASTFFRHQHADILG